MSENNFMNQQQSQSLLPYNDDYVLIHKRALVAYTACLSVTSEILTKNMSLTLDQVFAIFDAGISTAFEQMTSEQVSGRADSMVANLPKSQSEQLIYNLINQLDQTTNGQSF
jgi:hypothetical protein